MNWTGGRLQRHSKANADATARKHKQHFAKARLRLEMRPPGPTISHRNTQDSIDIHLRHRYSIAPGTTGDEAAEQHTQQSQRIPTKYRRSHVRQKISNVYPVHDQRSPQASQARPQQSSEETFQPKTLEDVKKNLLLHSDWVGISSKKPVRMSFPLARESADVAKRRRITYEDKARQKQYHLRQLPPSSLDHQRRNPRDCAAKDISIRIGSNIQQSQPTITATPRPAIQAAQDTSSESMLLDKESMYNLGDDGSAAKLEALDDTSMGGARESFMFLKEDGTLGDTSDENALPTLDKFLDNQNFDQVRAKSSSKSVSLRSQSTWPSSPPARPILKEDSSNPFSGGNECHAVPTSKQDNDFRIAEMERWQSSAAAPQARPIFTLERQAMDASKLLPSASPQLLLTQELTLKRQREDASEHIETRSRPMGYANPEALNNPSSQMRQQLHRSMPTPQADTASNDNELWAKLILGDEYNGMNDRFQFQQHREHPTFNPKRARHGRPYGNTSDSSLEALTWTSGPAPRSTPKTFVTSANTVLYAAQQKSPSRPSETDFLSQLSPMEGVIDGRLHDPSLHNHGGRSERSFISAPSMPPTFLGHIPSPNLRNRSHNESSMDSDMQNSHTHESGDLSTDANHSQGDNFWSTPRQSMGEQGSHFFHSPANVSQSYSCVNPTIGGGPIRC